MWAKLYRPMLQLQSSFVFRTVLGQVKTFSCGRNPYYYSASLRDGSRIAEIGSWKRGLKETANLHRTFSVTCSNSGLLSKKVSPILEKDPDGWKLVYRFKHIVLARAVQRLKIYQTVFSCFIITPAAVFSYYSGTLQEGAALFLFGGSAFACIMLYVMGTIFSRIVGQMYLSPKLPEKVKIARLSFWGNRVDKVYAIREFAPFSDLNINPKDIYFQIERYGTEEKIYFSLRFGLYKKMEDIEHIFGPIPPEWGYKREATEKVADKK